ncbi:MAG: mycothione reductase [Acidimicrobiia bacterium]
MNAHYDLIILGAGSGNSVLSDAFDGKRVAIVEPDAFGGTCLNRGCIPTKMLVHAADLAYTAAGSERFGVDLSLNGVDWPAIRERVFDRIDPIAERGKEYRKGLENVDVYEGTASFLGERRVEIELNDGTIEISGDQIVIAVGARPHLPQLPGLETVPFHTSDTIMRVDELPKRVGIIGGGYIASEMAHVLGALGCAETVFVRGDRFLKHEDDDIAHAFTTAMQDRFACIMNARLTAVAKRGDAIVVTHDVSGVPNDIVVDALLVATGRVPNADQINAAAGGIELTPDGRVLVDQYGRTSATGVWALGDVCSPFQLKHVANHEARVIANNITQPGDEARWQVIAKDPVPHAVFAHPQIASAGMTESEARAAGLDIEVARRDYADSAWGWALEDTTSFVKLIMDSASRTLLGGHIIGPHAASLIQPIIQMMRFKQTVDEVATQPYYIHPAPSEVIEQALLELC